MLQLTQLFIQAWDDSTIKKEDRIQALQLDYFKCSAIKRDILDHKLFKQYKKHYVTLLTLLNTYRANEVKKQIAKFEDIIRPLHWENKGKSCEAKLQELHSLWKNTLPAHLNDMLSIKTRSSRWKKNEISPQEKLSKLYKHWQGAFADQGSLPQIERWDEVEIREHEEFQLNGYLERDPTALYSMLARMVAKKLDNIQEAIICQKKNLDNIVHLNFRYFTYEEWAEKLEKELERLPIGKRKAYLIKLKGTIEAIPYNNSILKVLHVNEVGEWENKNDIIHQKMFTGYIDYLLSNPKQANNPHLERSESEKKVYRLNYKGDISKFLQGIHTYNGKYWIIENPKEFVNFYFISDNTIIPSINYQPSLGLIINKNLAFAKLLYLLQDRVGGTGEIVKFMSINFGFKEGSVKAICNEGKLPTIEININQFV